MQPALVRIDGTTHTVAPGGRLVFGRTEQDGVIGLDPHDRGISARAGQVVARDGRWWVENLSTRRSLLLELESGYPRTVLRPGQCHAVATSPVSVLVPGDRFTHPIEATVAVADLARTPDAADGSSTLGLQTVVLNPREWVSVVALCSTMLLPFPRRSDQPLTYAEAERACGGAVSRRGIERTVSRLRERLANPRPDPAGPAGPGENPLYFDGPQALPELCRYLIDARVVGPADLDRFLALARAGRLADVLGRTQES